MFDQYGPKYWGERLNVSASTAQRYMRKGIIPNAVQTAGGHWRAPYSFFAMQEAGLRAGLFSVKLIDGELVYQDHTRLSPELLKHFDGVFDLHRPVHKRASLPYRLAMALTRAEAGLEVTFNKLEYYDEKIREMLASDDPEAAFREAKRCSLFSAWQPKDMYLDECKREVEAGRVTYAILMAAHALAIRSYSAGESMDYMGLVLKYWRILNGKKIANEYKQSWSVDQNGVFRPQLAWVKGSPSSFYKACPKTMQMMAARRANAILHNEPPKSPKDELQAKPSDTTHRDHKNPACHR